MISTLREIIKAIRMKYIKALFYIDLPRYMKLIVSYYKAKGMKFPSGFPNYISKSVSFDGTDYSLISIGEGVTLSMDVSILTHDGSVKTLYIDMIDDNLNQEAIKVWHKEDMCRIRGGGNHRRPYVCWSKKFFAARNYNRPSLLNWSRKCC